MGKRSKAAKRADRQAAREAAYRYRNNPYEEGTRLWKFYEEARAHKAVMDFMFEEMEEIYGPAGTPRPVVDNIPGTFRKAPRTQTEIRT